LDSAISGEFPKSLPYRIVYSNHCEDGVCVARIYKNDSTDDPLLPPSIPNWKAVESKAIDVEMEYGEGDCPSRKMPGAFMD
jgi:hypothetical protein